MNKICHCVKQSNSPRFAVNVLLRALKQGLEINVASPKHDISGQVASATRGAMQAEAMRFITKEQSIGRLGSADEIAAACCGPTSGAHFVIGVGLLV